MAIKSILVHLDSLSRSADLLGVSASIAEASSAHLIALHVVPDAYIPSTVPPEVMGELIEAQRSANEASAAAIEAQYRQTVAGLRGPTEWRLERAKFQTVADVVINSGRTVDLIVIGQPEARSDILGGVGVAEEVMLGVGRPVLLVPSKGSIGPIGKRILVAWKNTREAARAVFDAMPLMVDAEMVHVLTVQHTRRNSPDRPGLASGADIAATLARHDVRCQIIEATAQDHAVAEEILKQTREHSCDLVVMGGYGHSRIREMLLGGATRGIFNATTVPVLMSH